jgi:hypothetical protein
LGFIPLSSPLLELSSTFVAIISWSPVLNSRGDLIVAIRTESLDEQRKWENREKKKEKKGKREKEIVKKKKKNLKKGPIKTFFYSIKSVQ